jgi:hypothetical protein
VVSTEVFEVLDGTNQSTPLIGHCNYYYYVLSVTQLGAIPLSIGVLQNLECLYLHENNFTGAVPDNLRLLKKLRGVFLFGNQIESKFKLVSVCCGGVSQCVRAYSILPSTTNIGASVQQQPVQYMHNHHGLLLV